MHKILKTSPHKRKELFTKKYVIKRSLITQAYRILQFLKTD